MEEQGRYKVLVVDDEPMAVKAICRIIEKNCQAFEIVGEAQNGKQALEEIEKTHPDVVLTDIQMPVMTGLTMAKQAKERFPDLRFVVISGYQDYEYMREAIQSGVLDYLAKPIVPSAITAMMERIRQQLDLLFYERRNELLRTISQGKKAEPERLSRYFLYRKFYAALVRENGLPRRFSRTAEPEIFGNIQESFCVYGRDSMEQMFLIPAQLLGDQRIEEYMQKMCRQQMRQENSYITLLYYGRPFSVEKVFEKAEGLYHWLNAVSTVGVSQCLDLDHVNPDLALQSVPDEKMLEEFLHELQHYAQTRQTEKMKERISYAYDKWAEEKRPQLWLEYVSRRLLNFLRQVNPQDRVSLLESECYLEDAFYYATNMQMLRENLENVFYRLDSEQKEKPKVDSPEYFKNIEDYLTRHMAEPVSLESLSEHFAISQAYMSKLFRKYSEQSFTQYLTRLRMERAKQLMKEFSSLYVKDIAALVGYHDQFYFSRIFRSYTGRSPADYLRQEN